MKWLNPTEKLKAYWEVIGLVVLFEFAAILYWSFNRGNVDQFNYAIYFSSVLLLAFIYCMYLLYKAYIEKENMFINIFVATICILVCSASLNIVYSGLMNSTEK